MKKTNIMNSKICCYIILCIILFSCKEKEKSGLVGVWEIHKLKIIMNSYRNTDSTSVVEINGSKK